MATIAPKKRLLAEFAKIAKAVASPTRLELLDLVAQGQKSVDALARQAGISVTNASNHLKELRMAGLITPRKDGAYVYYGLADVAVHEFLRSLQAIAELRSAEARRIVEDYFVKPDNLEPVSVSNLLHRMRTDDVVVLDVRPRDEYDSGHIPGAISLPVGELAGRLSELSPEKEIVAYCRGRYCVMALDAVDLLRTHGFRARRLEEGMPDWRLAGLEVSETYN